MFDAEQPSYKRFRDIYAERTLPVVAWVGAGLSAEAGLPSWRQLRAHLDEVGRAKARPLQIGDAERMCRDLDHVQAIRDNWRAFARLKEILGATTYRDEIRSQLSTLRPVPSRYERLWDLGLRGMFSLNLDKFAGRAFAAVRKGAKLHECSGRDLGRHLHILRSHPPFVANLHGVAEDERSWVFTHDDLAALLRDESYSTFVNSVLATNVVLFVGISADDVAAGGFLARLRMSGGDPPPHFWVTDRTDAATDAWAEENGVHVIRYDALRHGHAPLDAFFADLKQYVPKDDEPPPVVSVVTAPVSALPEPNLLAKEEPEHIRKVLNAHAAQILSPGNDAAYKAYAEFCKRYERALYNSWYVNDQPPDNVVFGHRIMRRLAEGAFGRVYEAISPDGSRVAVKLLRNEIHRDDVMLGCFRRGVRSMQILATYGVKGVVSYLEAHELPACAVMEFVDGPTLEQAVEQKLLCWEERLRICLDVVRTVRTGHMLPQRVLHRDIRPPNVMLRGFYTGDWEVVVLDFDLSWHRDATERSLELSGATALGYLAPEQVIPQKGVSTRNALVDSFGIGMTMYFACCGAHPEAGAASASDWEERVTRGVCATPFQAWHSLPRRMARLILQSTRKQQRTRLGADQIEAELEKLSGCVRSDPAISHAELWAEELLQRAFPDEYKWDTDSLAGTVRFASGVQLTLSGEKLDSRLELAVRWQATGNENWKNISKYLPSQVDPIAHKLHKAGWATEMPSYGAGTFSFQANVKVAQVRQNPEQVVSVMQEFLRLRFA